MPSSDTQFKPGNPGGPGRPKGSVSLKTLLRKKLAEQVEGDPKERTYDQALIDATIRDALKGDASARKLIWEYIDGKAGEPEADPDAVVPIIDDIPRDAKA